MSLYGMMKTGVSGMAAQANRLGAVADNIANANTTGYKKAYTEFSSLITPGTLGSYNSGGVQTTIRYAISQQGPLQFTSSTNDLAINGDGFFVVKDGSGSPYLARDGTFVPDGSGRLVNAAGFYLTGYSYNAGEPSVVANGFDGLEIVSIADFELTAEASTFGTLSANLPADAEIVPPGNLPSANGANAQYSAKTSVVVFDNLGGKRLVDVYFTKSGPNEWEVAVYDQALASPGSSFPYEPGGLLTTISLEFEPTSGKLTPASANSFTFQVANGAGFELDLSATSQFATGFDVRSTTINGNAPTSIDRVQISSDGVVSALYKDGSERKLYRIPLATVQSPDQLTVVSGNVYLQGPDSGDIQIGFPQTGKFGGLVSGALEGSNVDIAEELTNMIGSQRNYTANSKVFQTGSDLLDVLVNLKR